MEFTHIVTAPLLEDFSKTKQSEGVIPELVWKLITNSATDDLSLCRVPYGDSIGLPGFDGLVSTTNGYKHYLPKGTSYWEIGTGGKPGNKATSDYKKRTLDEDTKLSAEVLAESAYVFLTPLSKAWSITAQQRWSGKRKSDGWKEIKIIDGIVLADWLREFPAIAKWLLKKIGLVKSTIGFSTIAEHWELIPQSSNPEDPKLPPELFIIGRDKVCEEISKLFRGEVNQLFVAIESTEDLEDLVSSYVESLNPELAIQLTDKCLLVNNAEAWQELVQLKSPHIFVASPNLSIHTNNDLHMAAIKNGHRVIIPIAGMGNNDRGDILSIRSPRRSQIENVLVEGGFSHDRANELANKGGLSPLKRYLRGLESMPNYATWDNVGLLSLLNLLGQFNSENASDNQIVENLVGKPKGVWFEEAISLTRKQDSPLEHFAGKWKLNSRVEAWQVLGPRITKENLDKFSDIAVEVLGAEHPKFSLPRDKLRTAHFYGVDLDHSESIREGIAETVAFLGAHSKDLINLSGVSGEYYAHKIVSQLLDSADWKRWASLNIYLPNLAEASPTAFLDAVDSTLGADPSPFLNLFALEEAGIFGGNYISGLLWALETLAWSPDYLLLATERLGELASLDPGGSWGNRPKNSLGEIFMPWHYQTTANQEKRLAAINRLEKISPKVYRELVNRLLPTPHETASGTRKPAWRDFCANYSSKAVTNGEYLSQIEIYTDLAIELSKQDFDLLLNIVGKFGHLPLKQTESLLNHLRSSAIQKLDLAQRNDLWSKITLDFTRSARQIIMSKTERSKLHEGYQIHG